MEINYSSQLGRFTCDKWVRLWWVRENKVSVASLASLSTPLRFPHANRNTLTYFVSSHKKGILCKIICYSHQPLCVSFSVLHYANTNLEILQSSRPVWVSLRWCLCSTPDSICSKFREREREIQSTSGWEPKYFHFVSHILCYSKTDILNSPFPTVTTSYLWYDNNFYRYECICVNVVIIHQMIKLY